MQVTTIYSTFNGEVNHYGIGSLTLFLRLQGCHLRCYLPTMGVLCDTPEALERTGGETLTPEEVVGRLEFMRLETGTNLICLTGGDPLWRKPAELNELFDKLGRTGFKVTVETSGTLSWEPYLHHEHVSFVLDYKLQSTGEGAKNLVNQLAHTLRERDYIKFVVHDVPDYEEMKRALRNLQTEAKVAAGVYWGGPVNTFQLYDWLKRDAMLEYLTGGMNLQAHKLVEFAALNPPAPDAEAFSRLR